MDRRAAWNPYDDGKQSSMEEPFRNLDFKGIEFDAFRKSAPLTRHDGRGDWNDGITRGVRNKGKTDEA